jgi:hypothetical protein
VKSAAALALFAVAQFAALIVSFFFFAAGSFSGDQRDPAMYWLAAAGIVILGSPAVGAGIWWYRGRAKRAAATEPPP